ncbi:hypothetical protein V8C43DRAFT_317341 [Trichoderma afarasin]
MSEDIPIRREKESNLWKYDRTHEKPKETKPSYDNHARHIEHPPIPNEVCIIRTREKPHRIISIVGGELRLLDAPVFTSGIFWYCYKKDNWCGFRNVTSGTFLGHYQTGQISATRRNHGVEEYFVPIRQQGGGYILHTFHPKKTELWQVAIKENDTENPLVEKREGGTSWDFINIKYVRRFIILECPGMEKECLIEPEYCV